MTTYSDDEVNSSIFILDIFPQLSVALFLLGVGKSEDFFVIKSNYALDLFVILHLDLSWGDNSVMKTICLSVYEEVLQSL